MTDSRLITIAIHTFDRAKQLRTILESEGIPVTLQNVNLDSPTTSAGVRLRIAESDLPRALRLIEAIQVISPDVSEKFASGGPAILVPVDFGEGYEDVIRLGFDLARMHSARLHLLHTYLDPGLADATGIQLSDALTFDGMDTLARESEIEEGVIEARMAKARMDKLARSLRADIMLGKLPQVKFDTEVTEGLPEEAIEATNTRLHPLLIIMATNSADAKSRAMNGSITGEVLNAAEATVLTVPRNAHPALTGKFHAAFFSTSRQDDLLALDTFARLFPEGNVRVTLVELPSRRNSHTDTSDNLADYCRRKYPDFTFQSATLSSDSPEKDFELIDKADRVDLIVFPNRRKNVIARLFSPTLAHRLLFNSTLPLLAISL